jgi:hypothetical protein
LPVEAPNGFGRLGIGGELDESEPPRATGFAIGDNVRTRDGPDRGEGLE